MEDKVARLKQRLRSCSVEEAGSAVCEDLLRLLQELFNHDITVGQPLYRELLTIPADRRKARDHILMLIYEKMHKSHENYERCWNDRESLRCALAQANQEVQRLDTDLKQACKIAAYEKQEMLQEVERLTGQWRDLSVAAAGEKQELVNEVQKLNDELREVTEAAAVEKQEIRDEVQQLINKLRMAAETAANDKLRLSTEIARLSNELQQQSASATTEKRTLSAEVVKLKDELRELTISSAAEKQEMTKELQRLTSKVKQVSATSTAEKQAMQLKLDAANTRNDRLAKEYEQALVQLETLTDDCTTDIQLKGKPDGVEKKVLSKSQDTSELTDANIHELMDETRQLLERIEFKDHSMTFFNKVKLPEIEHDQHQEKRQEKQQAFLQAAQELNNNIQESSPTGAHTIEVFPSQEPELQDLVIQDSTNKLSSASSQ